MLNKNVEVLMEAMVKWMRDKCVCSFTVGIQQLF